MNHMVYCNSTTAKRHGTKQEVCIDLTYDRLFTVNRSSYRLSAKGHLSDRFEALKAQCRYL